jgi:hypothetical protein
VSLGDFFDEILFKVDEAMDKVGDVIYAVERIANAALGPTDTLPDGTRPRRGDIVAVDRGVLWHYGIYDHDQSVIHFKEAFKYGKKGKIVRTSFDEFLADNDHFFVLGFNGSTVPWAYRIEHATEPSGERPPMELSNRALQYDPEEYQVVEVYSLEPDKVIAEAEKRLKDDDYDLFGNNCEHFAILCNTGRKESIQVNRLKDTLAALTGRYSIAVD